MPRARVLTRTSRQRPRRTAFASTRRIARCVSTSPHRSRNRRSRHYRRPLRAPSSRPSSSAWRATRHPHNALPFRELRPRPERLAPRGATVSLVRFESYEPLGLTCRCGDRRSTVLRSVTSNVLSSRATRAQPRFRMDTVGNLARARHHTAVRTAARFHAPRFHRPTHRG